MFGEGTRKPAIYINVTAKQRLDYLIRLCDLEISGLGEVVRAGNDFLITQVHLFQQEVTPASTDLSQDDVARFVYQFIQQRKDPSVLRFWWHSHASMNPFWSETDMKVIDNRDEGWMISYVGNHRGDYKLRLDLYGEIRLALTDLELRVYFPDDAVMRQGIAQEINQKVKEKKFPLLPAKNYNVPPADEMEVFTDGR